MMTPLQVARQIDKALVANHSEFVSDTDGHILYLSMSETFVLIHPSDSETIQYFKLIEVDAKGEPV